MNDAGIKDQYIFRFLSPNGYNVFFDLSYFFGSRHTIYCMTGVDFMRDISSDRAARLGEYIIETGATVRATAVVFKISKSTVHKDVTERLKKGDPILYRQVKKVLEKNKNERHIRGGLATKEKYKKSV